MKRFDFNELIEKAFSMGYEMGQKEFGAVKRENKKKKREWEIKDGDLSYYGARKVAERKFAPKNRKGYIPTNKEVDSISDEDVKIHNSRGRIKYGGNNEEIIYRGRNINNIIDAKDKKLKTDGRQKLKEYMDGGKRSLREYKEDGLLSIINDPNSIFRRNKSTKSLKKKAGLALAGTAAAAGIAYGAKKLYDKRKKAREEAKKNKEQNKKAED